MYVTFLIFNLRLDEWDGRVRRGGGGWRRMCLTLDVSESPAGGETISHLIRANRISLHLAEWDYSRKCHFVMTDHVPSAWPPESAPKKMYIRHILHAHTVLCAVTVSSGMLQWCQFHCNLTGVAERIPLIFTFWPGVCLQQHRRQIKPWFRKPLRIYKPATARGLLPSLWTPHTHIIKAVCFVLFWSPLKNNRTAPQWGQLQLMKVNFSLFGCGLLWVALLPPLPSAAWITL